MLTATETRRRIAAGSLTARDAIAAQLARIAEREPAIRAFAHHDPALAQVGEGPLSGIGFGVKDVLDTADQPSQYGSPIWAGHRPRADAACVALARRAGATILGKTVTTEFATRHPGPTANPRNTAHTPGGSSSGSAAAVADGMVHVGFGTQTAGSIIRPAAYCGVVGFKPSYGTLHRAGMKVMSESLDTIGVITRSVADAALAMRALNGGDYGDPDAKPSRAPRLALVMHPLAEAAPETLALMERAAEACRRAGATVTPVTLPDSVTRILDAHPLVMNGESAEALAWERTHYADKLSPVLAERMQWGAEQGHAAIAAGRAVFTAAQAAFAPAIAGFDAVLTPSAPGEAPEGLGWTGDPAFNSLWTALGVPCVTVPAGEGPRGLPLGVQIAAPFGQDRAALSLAEWVRQAVC